MPNQSNIEKHKWQKGQSGNPSGRPRGFPNLRIELESIIYASEGNAIHEIALKLFERAKQGDLRAIEFIMKMIYPDGIHKYEKEKAIDDVWGWESRIPTKPKKQIEFYHSLEKE